MMWDILFCLSDLSEKPARHGIRLQATLLAGKDQMQGTRSSKAKSQKQDRCLPRFWQPAACDIVIFFCFIFFVFWSEDTKKVGPGQGRHSRNRSQPPWCLPRWSHVLSNDDEPQTPRTASCSRLWWAGTTGKGLSVEKICRGVVHLPDTCNARQCTSTFSLLPMRSRLSDILFAFFEASRSWEHRVVLLQVKVFHSALWNLCFCNVVKKAKKIAHDVGRS